MPDDPQKQVQENSAKNLRKEKIKQISSQAHFYLRVICAWNYDEDGQPQDMGESFSAKISHSPDLTASGVMGWLAQHREMNGQKVKITLKFDHECKIRIPDHTTFSLCWSLRDGNHFSNRTCAYL